MVAISPSASAVLIGIAIFVVAGYQTALYRDILSETQKEFENVPANILIELFVACGLCLWGSLGLAGTFKRIGPYANQKGLDACRFRSDFMSFNHRGALIPFDSLPLKGSFD